MARPTSRHPTELELEILKVLWRDGPAPVRQVRDAIAGFRDLAATSVTTVMNIMVEKRYLARRKAGASFVYRARVTEKATTRRMLRDLLDRAFDGSAAAMMLGLVETADLDAREVGALRALLRRKSGEGRQ